MKVNVTVLETRTTEYVYEVNGVDSFETAKECAMQFVNNQGLPNVRMIKKAFCPPTKAIRCCELVEVN